MCGIQWQWIFNLILYMRNWDWKDSDSLPKSKGQKLGFELRSASFHGQPLSNATTKRVPGGYLAIFRSVTTVYALILASQVPWDMPVLSRGLGKIAWIFQHKLSVPLWKQCNEHKSSIFCEEWFSYSLAMCYSFYFISIGKWFYKLLKFFLEW